MKYIVEDSICDFPAWSGGADTLRTIIENGDGDILEEIFEDGFCYEGEVPTATEINDILWFERDVIANNMGYADWDGYERYHAWGEGDEVFWYDPAGDDYESGEVYEEACKRVWVIEEIDRECETAWIYEKDLGGPAGTEVPLSELELVKDK